MVLFHFQVQFFTTKKNCIRIALSKLWYKKVVQSKVWTEYFGLIFIIVATFKRFWKLGVIELCSHDVCLHLRATLQVPTAAGLRSRFAPPDLLGVLHLVQESSMQMSVESRWKKKIFSPNIRLGDVSSATTNATKWAGIIMFFACAARGNDNPERVRERRHKYRAPQLQFSRIVFARSNKKTSEQRYYTEVQFFACRAIKSTWFSRYFRQ